MKCCLRLGNIYQDCRASIYHLSVIGSYQQHNRYIWQHPVAVHSQEHKRCRHPESLIECALHIHSKHHCCPDGDSSVWGIGYRYCHID